MRILPRSAKGTWLLAVAVWAGLCAAAWQITPVRPHSEFGIPEDAMPIGLLSGPDVLVTATTHLAPMSRDVRRIASTGPIRLFDTTSGHVVASFSLPGTSDIRHWQISRTGHWLWLGFTNSKWRVMDLRDGSLSEFEATLSDDGTMNRFLGPDDEWLALRIRGRWRRFSVPDFRPLGEMPLATDKWAAVSSDGRAFAIVVPGNEAQISVADTTTGASIGRIRLPAGHDYSDLRLSNGGKVLACVAKNGREHRGVFAWELEVFAWDVTTGRELVRARADPNGWLDSLSSDGRSVVTWRAHFTYPPGPLDLRIWDLTTGRIVFDGELPQTHLLGYAPLASYRSPSGDYRVFAYLTDSSSLIQRAAEKLGIPWPFGKSQRTILQLLDAKTGQTLEFINGAIDTICWSSDGSRLATRDARDSTKILVWDLPPRKRGMWFALAAAILALPIAYVAHRRARQR